MKEEIWFTTHDGFHEEAPYSLEVYRGFRMVGRMRFTTREARDLYHTLGTFLSLILGA